MLELDKLDNPNEATAANLDVDLLFNSIQVNFQSFYREVTDYATEPVRIRVMRSGSNYENGWSGTTYNWMWNRAYQGVLINIELLIQSQEGAESPLYNYMGASKLLEAYILMTLVDIFGDVPYSEALQGTSNLSPVADPSQSIYDAAGVLIDEAIADFGQGSTVAPNSDVFYNGDLEGWANAARAMKMRYLLTRRLVDSGGGTEFQNLATDWDASAGDKDFCFYYGSNRALPNSRHPWYNAHYEADANDYMSNYHMWNMRAEGPWGVDDPRIRYFYYRQDWDYTDAGKWNQFTLDFVDFSDFSILNTPAHFPNDMPFGMATATGNIVNADGYYGRDMGNADGIPPDDQLRTIQGAYPAGGLFDSGDPADPSTFAHTQNNGTDGALGLGLWPIITASNVLFMRAEAAQAGMTSEDPRQLLEDAVRESISHVIGYSESIGQGGGALQPSDTVGGHIDQYVAAVLAAYDAPSGPHFADQMDVIQRAYWVSLFGGGTDAYNAYRRTSYPSNMQSTRELPAGDFPRTNWYPPDYVTLNGSASQKPDLNGQVFWDTNGSFPE